MKEGGDQESLKVGKNYLIITVSCNVCYVWLINALSIWDHKSLEVSVINRIGLT